MIYLPIILILFLSFLAGMLSGLMDTLENESSFKQSKLYKDYVSEVKWAKYMTWTEKYIDGNPLKGHKPYMWMWKIKLPYLDGLSDPWHRAKTAMIAMYGFSMCSAMFCPWVWSEWYMKGFQVAIVFGFFGLFNILGFNWAYIKLLKK